MVRISHTLLPARSPRGPPTVSRQDPRGATEALRTCKNAYKVARAPVAETEVLQFFGKPPGPACRITQNISASTAFPGRARLGRGSLGRPKSCRRSVVPLRGVSILLHRHSKSTDAGVCRKSVEPPRPTLPISSKLESRSAHTHR